MADYVALLDMHLMGAYRENVVGRSPSGRGLARLKEAIQADADLRAEAQKRLASVSKMDRDRDFVSKTFRDFLTAALET